MHSEFLIKKQDQQFACFAHTLGKVKYLLALLAFLHTSRDTVRGEKGNGFQWAFYKVCSRYRAATWLFENTVTLLDVQEDHTCYS